MQKTNIVCWSVFWFLMGAIIFGFYKVDNSLSTYEVHKIVGKSMNPTLYENDKITIKITSSANEGDLITADCNSVKCENPTRKHLAKRLLYKKDSCYFIAGDNQPISFDSYDYGWLCNDELIITGIITKINDKQI